MSQEPSSKLSSPASSEQLEPKYKGVRKRKWGKWVSEIRLPNSRDRIWLGSFDSPEKAARAFDAAQFCLRGPSATFNFPDSPPNIVNGQSLSPQQIQVVAARYAHEHPIPTTSFLSTQGQQHCTDTSSSSAPSDRTVQAIDSNVDAKINDNASYIDWSFLNLLDNNDGVSDFCFFHGNELYPDYMTLAEAPENNQDNYDEEDEHSTLKLWNF